MNCGGVKGIICKIIALCLACAVSAAHCEPSRPVQPSDLAFMAEALAASIQMTAVISAQAVQEDRERRRTGYRPVDFDIIIGNGADIAIDNNHTILFGNCTSAPPHADGFVNIANKLCFWRTSGEITECPPPVLGCQ